LHKFKLHYKFNNTHKILVSVFNTLLFLFEYIKL
jgi:hypothetical protein